MNRFMLGVEWVSALAASSLALGVTFGCSQKAPERPAYAELSCEGEGCKSQGGGAPVVGVPPAKASDAEDDTRSAATGDPSSGASMLDAGTSVVVLDPREATDLQRTLGAPIGRPYALYGWPNVDAPLLTSTGLDVESVPVDAGGGWLLVLVTDAAEASDPVWLPTLTWQMPSNDPVIVPVFRSQFWTDLAAGLALAPTTLDPAASQVVVQVEDGAGQPMLGVSAEVVSGAVAYGNGGSASDVLTETDDSGVLVWINAPAGSGTTLTLRTGSELWSVVIPTRAASVTVAAVAQPTP